jgi:hypothetical protein
MTKPIYYIGAYKHNRTIVVQAVTNIDCLNCETVEYFGIRQTSKRHLKQYKAPLMEAIKKDLPYFRDCTKIVIE